MRIKNMEEKKIIINDKTLFNHLEKMYKELKNETDNNTIYNDNKTKLTITDEQKRECIHKALLNELHATYIQKNRAYGNSFGDTYNKLGIISAVTRISDKYNRMCTLATNSDINEGDESLRDTLMDMANYCIMTVMEMDKDKGTKND